MNAHQLVDKILEGGPDDVEAKDYLRKLPPVGVEQWVFSEAELLNPQNCKGTDELVATITVKANEEDEDDDDFLVHIIVLRNTTVTDRFAISPNWRGPDPELAAVVDFNAPVPQNLRDLANEQHTLYNPVTEDIAEHWRHVMAYETGEFVRLIDL